MTCRVPADKCFGCQTLHCSNYACDPDCCSSDIGTAADSSHADEAEGRISYPRPYSLAAAAPASAADEDEGKVAYPQVHVASGNFFLIGLLQASAAYVSFTQEPATLHLQDLLRPYCLLGQKFRLHCSCMPIA